MVRLLEIIGEAATRTPSSIKDQHPTIPWRRITGLRNRLVHAYDTVDIEIVWRVEDGQSVRTLVGHEREVNGVAFSPDGQSLQTGSPDGTARLWALS